MYKADECGENVSFLPTLEKIACLSSEMKWFSFKVGNISLNSLLLCTLRCMEITFVSWNSSWIGACTLLVLRLV